ncbi:MAG: hypothetical protein C0594_14275 [Marinilabiliales bacterium]|nr:MAG: hypothetical protein C0594_14275 [Marinilabiliales bacterium]
MKRILIATILLSFIALSPVVSNAQCKSFAKKICKSILEPYVHDGIYNATVLSEGETAELFKTFYSGQEYRIAVCGAEDIPNVEFQVLDAERNVLYSNTDNDYSKTWDFKLEASQQLIIAIQVQTADELSDEIASGCVAVLIGFMNVENQFE